MRSKQDGWRVKRNWCGVSEICLV